MEITPLTRLAVDVATFVAIASLLLAAAGLLVARTARRSAPLRHGLLLATLGLLLVLPAAPFAGALIDLGAMPELRAVVEPVTSRVEAVAEPTRHVASNSAEASRGPGIESQASLRTLTEDQIPEGTVLPGRGTRAGLNPAARRSDVRWAINVTAAGQAAVVGWLSGLLVTLSVTLRGARRVARLVHHSSPIVEPDVLALARQMASHVRLRRVPQLLCSPLVGVPFAWGLLRPVIVLPTSLLQAPPDIRLGPILLHELAHVQRGDAWIGLLQRVAAALYWWNPLVHRLNARLAEARELICDAHVLAGGCPPRDYAEVLVELAAQVTLPLPAAAISLLSRSQSQLTCRVQHLLEDPPMFTSLRWLGKLCIMGLIIVGTTTAVLIAAVMFEDLRGSMAQATPQTSSYSGEIAIRNSYAPSSQIPVPAAQPAAEMFAEPGPVEPVLRDLGASEPLPDGIGALEMNPFVEPDTLTMSPPPLAGSDAPFFGGDGSAPVTQPYYPGTLVDPGVAAPAETGPTPNPNWPPKGGPQFIGEGTIHALAAIDLVAGDDGALREIRWFTESLGAGDEAATKLGERLKQFVATQPATVFRLQLRHTPGGPIYVNVPMQVASPMPAVEPMLPDGDFMGPSNSSRAGAAGAAEAPFQRVLAAQVTASPQLRYEHVARVIALCESHVQRVIIVGEADAAPALKLTLGFVRDGAGNKISSSPVLIWNDAIISRPSFETAMVNGRPTSKTRLVTEIVPDKVVEVHALPPLLMNWRQTIKDSDLPRNRTALIRADDGVDPVLVEQVVQAVLPAGIERVVLEPLTTPDPAPANVQAVITEVQQTATDIRVWISIGADDGVQLGTSFFYRTPPPIPHPVDWMNAKGELEVIQIGLDASECRIIRASAPPEVGFHVSTQGTITSPAPQPEAAPVVEPAVEST